MTSDWMTLKEAAIRTGVSVRSIWRYIDQFDLDTGRDRGRTLVNIKDVRKAIMDNPRGNPMTARHLD